MWLEMAKVNPLDGYVSNKNQWANYITLWKDACKRE